MARPKTERTSGLRTGLHIRLCETWSKNKLDQRMRELNDIRKQRLQSILDRLEAIDLRDEAELILRGKSDFTTAHEFYNHRLTIRLKREHIQKCQERYAHLEQEYHDIMSRQDLREPYPSIGDILTDPIFEDMICNSATDKAVTPEILRAMLTEELPRIINKWRPAKLRTLLRILRRGRPNATNSDFHLAITVFGCAICDLLLVYPQMFYHQCCFMKCAGDEDLDEFFETVEQGPWSASPIFFHSQSSRLVEKIVIGAGLDPFISTTCDLTLARPVIECSSRDAFPLRKFMTWPAALTHNLTVQDEVLFTINCFGPETWKIRTQELLSHFTDICCAHCHEEIIPRELCQHLTNVHNIEAESASPSSAATVFYKQFQRHWYWNPRANLNMIGMEFHCKF
ncbi:hypothetical protein F5877DRAFT_73193 [Lentinula edodes]|nr:hypothetical protein F5877DRAFT_73193 [Lentinula edodes]